MESSVCMDVANWLHEEYEWREREKERIMYMCVLKATVLEILIMLREN